MKKYIGYCIVLLPAIIYFFYVYKLATDIPSMDDYDAVLDFINKYKTVHRIDKIPLIWEQYNEHRIISSRIVFIIYYKLFGGVNFRHLVFIGNIQLLLTYTILVYFIRKRLPGHWILASFGVGCCLFDLSNWQNAYQSLSSMANYGVIFLFSMSLFLYSLNKNKFIFPAILCQVLCIYANGNGMVGAAFIVGFNLMAKNKPAIISSALAFIVFAPLYFYHYVAPPTGHVVSDIDKVTIYFFHMISAHIYMQEKTLPLIIGMALFAGIVCLVPVDKKLKIDNDSLPFVCIGGFIGATMLLTALFRSNMGDYPASRYLIYPHFLAAILFIFLLIRFRGSKRTIFISAISICSLLLVYIFNFNNGKNDFAHEEKLMKENKYYYPPQDINVAKSITLRSCELKIYCIDEHR